MQIEAVYQAGVLRPLQPLNLLEGSKLQLIVVEPTTEIIPSKAATMLQLIADLPEEGSTDLFSGMDKRLKMRYDKVGDILYLDICLPYSEQETEELEDEIIARMNPTSGAIENLEILFFFRRCDQMNLWELPIQADFKLVS